MILAIRTDKPEAELTLLDAGVVLATHSWLAHRQLADTILSSIETLLATEGKDFTALTGVIVFAGPGSFTGLRIGSATANALAYSLRIPVVATSGTRWQQEGVEKISTGNVDAIALPEYGGEANITLPKK